MTASACRLVNMSNPENGRAGYCRWKGGAKSSARLSAVRKCNLPVVGFCQLTTAVKSVGAFGPGPDADTEPNWYAPASQLPFPAEGRETPREVHTTCKTPLTLCSPQIPARSDEANTAGSHAAPETLTPAAVGQSVPIPLQFELAGAHGNGELNELNP
jgi:hypothetical protein